MNQGAGLNGLKAVLALIGLYHIGLGAIPFVAKDSAAQIAASLFGMTLVVTPQLQYIAQLLGVYALAFGLVALLVATNPVKYRSFTYVVIALYALRIINRLMFIQQFRDAFQTTLFRAWLDVVLLALFGVAVIVLRPRAAQAG